MWRGRSRYFSTYTPPSPKAFCASRRAAWNAFSTSASLVTSRIPFPPPPAAACRLPRIQVEHPVTELVYGVDLVREQLRIAAGHPMRVHGATGPGGQLHPRGHAIECRITAEDPFNDFLPATGVLQYVRVPSGPGVRWDGGFEAGNEVT